MQDIRTDRSAKVPRRSSVPRRIVSVVLGAISFGLLVLIGLGIADVAATYGSAFEGGWTILWVLVGLMASVFGAGAVVFWNPPRPLSMWRAVFFWMVGIAIVVVAALFLFVPALG